MQFLTNKEVSERSECEPCWTAAFDLLTTIFNSKKLTRPRLKRPLLKTSNVDSVKVTIGVPTVPTRTTSKESLTKVRPLSIVHQSTPDDLTSSFFNSIEQETAAASGSSSSAYKPPSMRAGAVPSSSAPGKKFDQRPGENNELMAATPKDNRFTLFVFPLS